MINELNELYTEMYKELKQHLVDNSKYSPKVYKKEPNTKEFPLVVMKWLSTRGRYTTLKYTDEIYNMDLEINTYAIQNGKIANMTIADEITGWIEDYFHTKYKVPARTTRDVLNIDTDVYRNLTTVRFKVDTKYKDKLIISPR